MSDPARADLRRFRALSPSRSPGACRFVPRRPRRPRLRDGLFTVSEVTLLRTDGGGVVGRACDIIEGLLDGHLTRTWHGEEHNYLPWQGSAALRNHTTSRIPLVP